MFTKNMNLNEVICNHIALVPGALTPNAYGLEVELEGQNICSPPYEVQLYWTTHNDGSLRKLKENDQCIEYIFRRPYNMKETTEAISALFNYLTNPKVKVYDSYRTSIHVHVNCAVESYRTIYNFMTLALIFDELFVSQNGDHRIGNNFCLRARDAMGQLVSLIQSIEMGHDFYGVPSNDRYSSINFASLQKFGSIEFRSLECTIHQGRLIHWIGTLQQMKEAAKGFKNPTEIIQKFSLMDAREFVSLILGPFALKYLSVPDFERMLHNGMRIAQDLAYCSEWKEVATE